MNIKNYNKFIIVTILCLSALLVISSCAAKDDEVSQVEDAVTTVFEKIDSDRAIELMAELSDYRLVDVRTQEEFDEGHIKGAELMPLDQLESLAGDQLNDKDQVLIVYCRSGNRSGQASDLLKELGYTHVYDLGGIINWTGEIEK
ncbi:rhodanese-like domain-containing protein [Fusibacter bizertensis]|uniref:Rhodanese-like domain-containing protein n=1 Tax=Fusibacter bizertensis TaxID=1488331 RepID=A0ABT6NAL7_9FIRM|nr:rhodanese-like domain-containing protein [Fusibacter bizertensis]MDH8677460.1 rhodanese-like domain-containing protein [Fusibacter bizertensis]